MMLRSTFVILLCVFCAGLAAAQAPATTVELVDLHNTLAVRAKVGGQDALLIIDTGSYELRLRPGFAQKAELHLRAAGEDFSGTAELRLGTFVDPKAKVLIQTKPLPFEGDATKAKVDGIIGLSFLQNHAVGLDLIGYRLALWPGGHVDAKALSQWTGAGPAAVSFPLRGTPKEGAWYKVRTEIEGRGLDFVLDTGSTWTTVAPRFSKGILATRVGPVASFSFSGNSAVTACVAKTVRFGPIGLANQIVAIDGADDEYDGLLGLQSLRNCRIVLDFPAQRAMASRVETFVQRDHESPLIAQGLELMRLADDRLMAVVATGSPAEKAGVRTGDLLLSLNGRPAEELVALMKQNIREDSVAAWGAALTHKVFTFVIRTPEGSTKKLSLQRT